MLKQDKTIESDWQYSQFGILSEKYGRIIFHIEDSGIACHIAAIADIDIRNIKDRKECIKAFKENLEWYRQKLFIVVINSLEKKLLTFLKDVGFTEVKKANHNNMIFFVFHSKK